MSIGFYDLLQVAPDANAEAIRSAYQEQIAQVVRKLRAAEARQQDVASIEARRASLAEAWAVLSDPTRRRRYDRYRELSRHGLPTDTEGLWASAGPSLVDPAAAAAVEVVRTLTDLRLGEPVAPPTPVTVEPDIGVVQIRPVEPPRHDAARGEAPRADGRPESQRADGPPQIRLRVASEPLRVMAEAANMAPEQASEPPAAPQRDPREQREYREPRDTRDSRDRPPGVTRPMNAPAPALTLDRNVSAEDLARLFDHYGPTGAFLRAVRELRRITLQNLSANTRISLRFLDAMERDAYTDLPGATFVRGYLKMVVRALEAIPAGPEMDEFAEGYMSRYHRARG